MARGSPLSPPFGVYTAASGAGLACSGQWPACDGGLLPTTLPSFIEWFHRLVASVVGVMILGTAVWAWRRYRSRRIRLATLGALLVLPSQLVLGGATVFVYTPLVQTAHHAAAMLIFAGLFAATLWAREAEITQLSHSRGLGLWFVRWVLDAYGDGFELDTGDGGTTVVLRLRRA
ncbi:hypothetical protein BRD17_02795 [Halobacteriales archaeon SW_7_68_16]|nr:MAG: hypothetical protein BRD17_02795 [Halobacteriales archaeon SW_7_68_16]